MAHIAACMVPESDGEINSIKSFMSSTPSVQASTDSSSSTSQDDRGFFTRRMQKQQPKKYSIFPQDMQQQPAVNLSIPGRSPTPSATHSLGQGDKKEKSSFSSGLLSRIKGHNLMRKHKNNALDRGSSVTKVDLPLMDSPTIPGRPALHERSVSTPPVNNLRISLPTWPKSGTTKPAVKSPAPKTGVGTLDLKPAPEPPKSPPASKDLTQSSFFNRSPTLPSVPQKFSFSRLRKADSSLDLTSRPRSNDLPKPRAPFSLLASLSSMDLTSTSKSGTSNIKERGISKPILTVTDDFAPPRPWVAGKSHSSTDLTTPSPAPVPVLSVPAPVPVPIPEPETLRPSHPWARSLSSLGTTSGSPTPLSGSPERHAPTHPWTRSRSSLGTTPQASTTKLDTDVHARSASVISHSRVQSESGVLERGRPLRRPDESFLAMNHAPPKSRRSKSAQRKAFETLPQGYRLATASKMLDKAEITQLQRQALGQATKFEVLKKEDVDNLSKELRLLDQKAEYLRHTYTTLRAGRRKFQQRICQYLRGPRAGSISFESVLKQEESLAELDASIDDWATNLEQVENRRIRVRQKLLEHIAAAAAMSATNNVGGALPTQMQLRTSDIFARSESPAQGSAYLDVFPVPPLSLPQRPTAIYEDENENHDSGDSIGNRKSTLQRMQSIRIYVDNEVHSLLSDVENRLSKYHDGVLGSEPDPLPQLPIPAHYGNLRMPSRSRSYDVPGRGNSPSVVSRSSSQLRAPLPPPPPPPPPPPKKDLEFLTPAVFQPASVHI